ncbi:GntR family transcriptional regulator [Lacticaseibacillus saniviri]|uniref:CitR protein n=1 Tax=Lacticaseibacillus saniviri JCM 17471 = DSM 24301 TaxID=1293598 RepID=A0A0R2MU99_9LACO|nr:GntR family transcriptional regulator [Lacticaseibacillus saniviri]KRO17198.1 citR protein [Lacticaseibacillus saniviri JCM 17471 = DSM 24301]MCG4282146.1 GntR family transcriptional regulator [Lacticaseibacillus saniviri]
MDAISAAVARNLDLTQNQPLKDLVYAAFRKTIILGEIPSGERINEKLFADTMNISRTPVRYALERLIEEDLVARKPGIGVVVKGIRIQDAYEIFAIRRELDALATRQAMKIMTVEQFDDLKALLEQTDQLNQQNRIDEVLANFTRFNDMIYDDSQMFRLKSIVKKLREYLFYFRDISVHAKERRDKALAEHWQIFRAMQQQDVDQINTLTREHLDRSLNFIIQEMRKHDIN